VILAGDAQIKALLERSSSVAVVGASANAARPSKDVFDSLVRDARFTPTPINPTLAEIDGIAAFPTLEAYTAQHGAPDIVNVFRNPAEAPEVSREAIAAGAKAIWFQLGVVNDDAIAAADAAGLDVVVDRCLKIEIARLLR
jgi:predicted CoA-binding protein